MKFKSNVEAQAKLFVGNTTSANATRFPNAISVFSTVPSGIQQNETLYMGIMGEAYSVLDTWASGLYGAGYTNSTGSGRGTGVTGEGHVSASADTGVAVGVRGYANDVHSGNYNIGLYGDATNGSNATYGGNVALFLANGNIVTSAAAAKTWYLGGNITFDGQGSSKVIGVTNGASFALGTVTSGTWNATAIADTYIASASIWNAKQAALNGTGFVKISGTTISYDNSTYYLASNPNGYTSNTGTVTSVSMSVPTGLTITGSPITTAGTLALTLTTGYSIPTTSSQSNWDTAYTNRITSLTTTGSGAATLVANVLNIPTPSIPSVGTWGALNYPTWTSGTPFVKMTAAGTFALDTNTYYLASNPSGFTSNTGTVTSVSGTGSYGGLTLTGTITTSGSLTLGGTPTGTWPISVSGNAATATSATSATTATTATNLSGGSANATSITATSISVYGNGASADPYGTMAVTEPANASNYSYYGLTRAGNMGGGFGLTGTTGALGLGANSYWFGSATGAAGVMGSAWIAFNGSSFIANGDIRSTIFYDSNNTGYYLDPASTSNLNIVRAANSLTGAWIGVDNSSSTTGNGISLYGGASSGQPTYGLMFAGTATFGTYGGVTADWATYFNMDNTTNRGWIFRVTNGVPAAYNVASLSNSGVFSTSGYIYSSTYVQAGSQMYSPIYYDANNTGYYIDPASTSNVNAITATSVTVDGLSYVTANGYFRSGTNGFRWNDSSGNYNNVIMRDNGTTWFRNYIETPDSARAPIFYDINDTLYYVDPASSSNLSQLQLIGASNKYLYLNPGVGYEAMLRVQGGTGSSWYAGKRTTSTTQVGTDGFHFYSDAGADTVVGFGTDGTIKAKGDVVAYASSDRQLKDNITPIENALEKVKQIGGYTFDWNDKQTVYEGHDVGVIAQEIESVLPEVVTTRDTGFKAVKYEKIVPLLIEAIKEQQTQIEELKELVNKLINKQ